MGKVSIIGLDLAKSVFQAHGADASGTVIFRKKLRRDRVLGFFASQPACLVAMEACASAHYWAPEIVALGHDTRLIAPAYVKPFVKRQNDAPDDAVRGRQEHPGAGRLGAVPRARPPGAPEDPDDQRAARTPGRVWRRGRKGPGHSGQSLGAGSCMQMRKSVPRRIQGDVDQKPCQEFWNDALPEGGPPTSGRHQSRLVGFRRCGRGPQRIGRPARTMPPALALCDRSSCRPCPRASPCRRSR